MSAKKKAAGLSKRAKSAKAPKKRAPVAKVAKKAAKGKKVVAAAKKAATKKVVAKKAGAKKSAAKKVARKAAPKPVAKAKTAVAKKPAKRAAPKPKAPAMKRRDGAGHLDPAYEADLRERIESQPKDDENRAFGADALGNELGEEFVETVTSGEDEGTELRDAKVTEEMGGPFTVTTGGTEFGSDVDESNPEEATREPFPTS